MLLLRGIPVNPGGGLVALTPSPGGGVGRLVAFVGKGLLNPEIQKHSKPLPLLTEKNPTVLLKCGMELFTGYRADVYLVVGSWK